MMFCFSGAYKLPWQQPGSAHSSPQSYWSIHIVLCASKTQKVYNGCTYIGDSNSPFARTGRAQRWDWRSARECRGVWRYTPWSMETANTDTDCTIREQHIGSVRPNSEAAVYTPKVTVAIPCSKRAALAFLNSFFMWADMRNLLNWVKESVTHDWKGLLDSNLCHTKLETPSNLPIKPYLCLWYYLSKSANKIVRNVKRYCLIIVNKNSECLAFSLSSCKTSNYSGPHTITKFHLSFFTRLLGADKSNPFSWHTTLAGFNVL